MSRKQRCLMEPSTQKAVELYNDGIGVPDIAKQLFMSEGTVYYRLFAAGARMPHRVSREEERKMQELRDNGVSIIGISEITGYSEFTVKRYTYPRIGENGKAIYGKSPFKKGRAKDNG